LIRPKTAARWTCLAALGLLLLTPGSSAQEAHPNDEKVVFFRHPHKEAKARIEKAVTDLFSRSTASERRQGRRICYEYPLWSVTYLRKILNGSVRSTPVQRWNAILTLARLADPRAVGELRAMADHDPSPQVRAFASLALGFQEGPEPVAILLRAFKREKSQDVIVSASIFALARMGGSEAEGALLGRARAGSSDLERRAVILSLGFFRTPQAAEAIRKALTDSQSRLRLVAVLALANAAVGPVEERQAELRAVYDRDSSGSVRAVALLALARFPRYRGIVELLSRAIEDEDNDVRAAAALALQHRGDPRTRPFVLAGIKREATGETRIAARLMLALAKMESRSPSEEGLRMLLRQLRATSRAVRVYAAIGLSRIGEGWEAYPEMRAEALARLRSALAKGALGDEERRTYRRAIARIDPEIADESAPAEWGTPWGVNDDVLPTIDQTFHQTFLDLTNWHVEEELGVHTLKEPTLQRREQGAGKAGRGIPEENQPIRDLKEWLEEEPFFTAKQLPDIGYGD
jgi:HEAT repeat protein